MALKLFHLFVMNAKTLQSCPAVYDSMDCSLPGFSFHGILQATILEWVAVSFPRGSFPPRDPTRVSFIGKRILYHWATWEAPLCYPGCLELTGHFYCKKFKDFKSILHLLTSPFCPILCVISSHLVKTMIKQSKMSVKYGFPFNLRSGCGFVIR